MPIGFLERLFLIKVDLVLDCFRMSKICWLREKICCHCERNLLACFFCSSDKQESARFISAGVSSAEDAVCCWTLAVHVPEDFGVMSADLRTVTSFNSQMGVLGAMVTTFAERLQILTGILAEVPGLSSLTTLGHTVTLDDEPFSAGSVTADSKSLLFRVNPVIVLLSMGCRTTLCVALTMPI